VPPSAPVIKAAPLIKTGVSAGDSAECRKDDSGTTIVGIVDNFGGLPCGKPDRAYVVKPADEVLWKEACDDIGRHSKPSVWFVPDVLCLLYRTTAGPQRYGKRDIPADRKVAVSFETLHIVRTAKILTWLCTLGAAWISAFPPGSADVASPVIFKEIIKGEDITGVLSGNWTFRPNSECARQLDVLVFSPEAKPEVWDFDEIVNDPTANHLTVSAHCTAPLRKMRSVGYWGNTIVVDKGVAAAKPVQDRNGTDAASWNDDVEIQHRIGQEPDGDQRKLEEFNEIGGLWRSVKALAKIFGLAGVGEAFYSQLCMNLEENQDAIDAVHHGIGADEGYPFLHRQAPLDKKIFPVLIDEMDGPELVGSVEQGYCTKEGDNLEVAVAMFKDSTNKGDVKAFTSFNELRTFLDGGDSVSSEIHVLSKTKNGRTKHRFILDCKKAGLSRNSRRSEHTLLPCVTDAVSNAFEMATDKAGGYDTMLFGVIDCTEAFWRIPSHKSEQRFFTMRVGQTSYVLLRTAQGSRGAPPTWSHFGTLLTRLLQGIFEPRRGRVNLYVDDLLLILVNTVQNCRCDFAMGVFKATSYCALGKCKIRLHGSVKPDTVAGNVVCTKELRSFVGKCTAVDSLVSMWSPLLKPLWASHTTAGTERSLAPRIRVWVMQFQESLVWIQAFLAAVGDMTTRTRNSGVYYGQGVNLEIDLRVQNRFEAYSADPFGQSDIEKFGFNNGDCMGRHTWECRATLVALRLGMSQWSDRRVGLRVRSDSTTAPRLLLSLKSTGSGPNSFGREIALDVAKGSDKPNVAVHLPGVANAGPDAFSRLFRGNKDKQVLSYLKASDATSHRSVMQTITSRTRYPPFRSSPLRRRRDMGEHVCPRLTRAYGIVTFEAGASQKTLL